jgi:hypothetical protein
MSKPLPEPVLLENPFWAFEAALEAQSWAAGPLQQPHWFRLAGGLVDGRTRLVTDVCVPRGNLILHTHLPLRVPPERLPAARTLCSVLAAGSVGICSLEPDGAPIIYFKTLLFEHEGEGAAAVVVDAIRDHRGKIMRAIFPAFTRVAEGEDVRSIAKQLGGEHLLPLTSYYHAALFDRAAMPEPRPDLRQEWFERIADAHGTDDEALGLAALWELNSALPNDAPLCAGPVLVHSDGTLECYGCMTPNVHRHPAGTSASCEPAYRPGVGHGCDRCR